MKLEVERLDQESIAMVIYAAMKSGSDMGWDDDFTLEYKISYEGLVNLRVVAAELIASLKAEAVVQAQS